MRTLHFALLTESSPQHGLRRALESISTEYKEFSWIPYYNKNRLGEMRSDFAALASEYKPDFTFIQSQTPNLLPLSLVKQITGIAINWNGDLRDTTPAHAFEMADGVISCFSNERDVDNLRKAGKRAEFLNIGFSEEVFCPEGPKREGTPEIVFAGTNYCNRFPRSAQRQRIVATLRERYGHRFAVYGNGWGKNDVFLQEPEEASAYRACKIALDANHYDNVPRFTSDRRFRAMASGAFTLANWHPGIEEDFKIGEHLVAWKSPEEIVPLIDRYLEDDAGRGEIADAGCAWVHERHSWKSRMVTLKEIIAKYAA